MRVYLKYGTERNERRSTEVQKISILWDNVLKILIKKKNIYLYVADSLIFTRFQYPSTDFFFFIDFGVCEGLLRVEVY